MATLPDLATVTISTLAYFDAGVAIKKSDLLSLFESFTEYDNGVDGVLSFTADGTRVSTGNRVQIRVRIRTDGMAYAWGLRADETKDGTQKDTLAPGGAVAWQRALLPVSALGNVAPAQFDTLLYRALLALVSAMTTPGKATPTAGTVSYYDFEFPATGNVYVFGSGTSGNSSTTSSFQFTQPAGVSVFVLAHHWTYQMGASGTGTGSGTMTVNGTTIATKGGLAIGSAGGVIWSARQGSAITTLLQAQGTQNNASVTQGSTGGTGSFGGFGVFVVYASS